jgi:ComF family protein
LTLSRAAALHTHPLRPAIHALKYEQQPALAAPLARYLTANFRRPPWPELAAQIDAVVPVPLHTQRLAERGYNQSELVAAAFCAQVGLTCAPGWLARTRATRQQVGLGPLERRTNVADAFRATGEVAGRTLLLVDDVCTTGATFRACAVAAQAAGARAVYALALAIPQQAV